MFGIREDKYDDSKWLQDIRQTYESAENGRVAVDFHAVVHAGGSMLTVTDPEGRRCRVEGSLPQVARTMPLTEDALIQRLEKCGGTPYRANRITCDIQDGLTLSAAAINALRRDALNQLTALRARRERPQIGRAEKIPHISNHNAHPGITVQVTTREQITGKLLKMRPEVLYVPLHILAADPLYCHELARKVNVAAVLPRILPDGEKDQALSRLRTIREMGIREVLVGNVGQLLLAREAGMRVRGDIGLNLYNSASVNLMQELKLRSAALSFEMTLPQIRDISKAVPCEILAYGRLPLMVTENCLIRSRSGSCSCNETPARLMDKTGAEFPVIRDGDKCRSILLNGKKLNWLDRQTDLGKLGLWAMRLYFTTENPRETDQILSAVTNPPPFDPGSSTRGLYLRGLDG